MKIKTLDDLRVADKRLPAAEKVKHYDFAEAVRAPNGFFRWLEGFLCKILLKPYKEHHTYIHIGMDDLPTPYLAFGTHMSFLDFPCVGAATLPKTAFTYVCAIDAIYDFTEWLLRRVGIIAKRKFIKDIMVLKNMKYSVTRLPQLSTMLYPEAKYSIDGTRSYIPPASGKLIKFLGVPVVVANLRGNYICQPQWRQVPAIAPLETEMRLILTQEEVDTLSAEECYARLYAAMDHDDFAYQKERGIVIDIPDRANGLNRLLYRCPKCGAEHETEGKGSTLTCLRCGKAWEMQTDGSLKATDGETEFSHIPDWYDWQQEAVRAEIEAGDYRFSDEVYVRTLPGANRFYNHGKGTLEHTADGRFILKCKAYGKDTEVEWSPVTLDGLHIEYNYKKVGDCVDLSVEDESYWLYPVTKKDALTKLSIATDIFHAKAVGQAWQK